MSRKAIIIVFCFFFFSQLSAARLKWSFNPKDRVEIVKTADVTYLINKQTKSHTQERNIVDLTCTGINDNKYSVSGVFSIFSKQPNEHIFKLLSKEDSSFSIDENGHFEVPKGNFMPNLRHLPTFPEREIKKGDSWTKDAEIVINNFSAPFSISMPVQYAVSEVDETTAEIHYAYSIDNYLEKGTVPQDFPRRILGKDEGIIHWDIKNNKPLNYRNMYHIVFMFPSADGTVLTHEWIMTIDTKHTLYPFIPVKEQQSDREKLKEDLGGTDGITVDEDDRGIVIRLGEILFDFDKADVKQDAEKTLADITKVIKSKYPDREIIVEGYTDNTGNPHYNQELSEKRAHNIAKRIIDKLDHDKVSYIGHGEANPISPNNTAEGRKRNRRVDIIIKLK